MAWKTILEFSDDGSAVKVEINPAHDLVGITEGANTDFPGHVALTIEGLVDVSKAVEQYLESAAEYANLAEVLHANLLG